MMDFGMIPAAFLGFVALVGMTLLLGGGRAQKYQPVPIYLRSSDRQIPDERYARDRF